MSSSTARSDLRGQLLRNMKPVETAWSVNGRDVEFVTDFDSGLEVGGFVVVRTSSDGVLLVQVQELVAGEREAMSVDVDAAMLGVEEGSIQGANVGLMVRFVRGRGQVLGAIGADGLEKSIADGFDGGELTPASAADVESLLDEVLGSSAPLAVGRLSRAAVDARLKAAGFSRHTFLCGQSGSGKTYSLGVLLERLLLETTLPLYVIDPNSDYVGLGAFRSRADINRSRATPMSNAAYADLKRRYQAGAQVSVASRGRGDLPLQIHLSDLTLEEQGLTFGLDPIGDADEYAALIEATRGLGERYGAVDVQDALLRRFDDASRKLAQRIGNLGVASWTVWARSGEPSLVDLVAGCRTVVFDTGSLPDARERSVVALALLGRLRRRPMRSAVSLVIDEAHNVCSPDAASPLERAVTDHTVWIAGEGRKFGIYMVLSTQRPQKVHRNVISQCDNLLLMRVNSVGDLDELAKVFSHVPSSMIGEARSFQLGEMLAAGPVSPTPMRLRMGERWSPEGGADLPTNWARRSVQ